MKLLLVLILLVELLLPAYGAEVCSETADSPTHLMKDFIQLNKNVLMHTNNCGLIKSDDDYWFCQAMEQQNCGLIRSSQGYWYCEALLKGNCNLTSGANYWMCESLLQKTCGHNRTDDQYWFCESILQGNCNLAKGNNYWLCRGVGDTLKKIVSPIRRDSLPKKDVPFTI